MKTTRLQKSESRQELLVNTIKFYNNSNRATRTREEGGGCFYRINGKSCAIGREITDSEAVDFGNTAICSIPTESIPNHLRDMGIGFLTDIQNLHDEGRCWDDIGLTDSGKRVVDRMIKEYKLENIDYEKTFPR